MALINWIVRNYYILFYSDRCVFTSIYDYFPIGKIVRMSGGWRVKSLGRGWFFVIGKDDEDGHNWKCYG